MRWGVRDDATNTHMTTELCLREIKACQEISVGPNFVVSALLMLTKLTPAKSFAWWMLMFFVLFDRHCSLRSMVTVRLYPLLMLRNLSCF